MLLSYVSTLIRAQSWRAALVLALMVGLSLMEGVGLLMLIPLLGLVGIDVDEGSMGMISRSVVGAFESVGLKPTLVTVLVVYVFIIAVHGVLTRWQSIVSFSLQRDFVVHLRKRLYRAIVNADWVFFSRSRTSDFTHVLTNEIERVGVATYHLLHLLALAIVTLVYLGLALKLSARMTAVVFVCGSLLLFLLRKKAAVARTAGKGLTQATKVLYGAISEHLGGIKTAKSYGAESRHADLFERMTEQVRDRFVDAVRNQAEVRFWFEVGAVLVLSIILYVSFEVLEIPTATVLVLLFLFARILPRFSSVQQDYLGFVNYMPSFAATMEMEEKCREAAEPSPPRREPVKFSEAVRLENVDFAYGDEPVIQNAVITIASGRTTAVVGPSGAGKSTIADLVTGLLQPTHGRVLIDGAPLTPARIPAWRDQIGYVPQDTFLFYDTIRANLAWARQDATEDDLWSALHMASADEFVSRLPQGLDTMVGDRGVRLSGGERQRLALARALLRKPSLLILDEATSNLDSENERRIVAAVDELHGSVTTLLISHRLSSVRDADLIYVLDNGQIVEFGTWQELIERTSGRFRALCEAQGIEPTAPTQHR